MENNEFFTGIIEDPRLDPKIQQGWNINEVLAESAALNWVVKSISDVKNYPVWNQAGTSACVAFSKAKQISIRVFNMTGVWIDFSPASIYQLRLNKPAGGMNISDANEIVNKTGVALDALMKSQNLTEEQIDAVKRTRVADLFAKAIAEAVVRYLYVPVNIDRIAQTIESGKAVSLLIFADYNEYSRMVPIVENFNLTYLAAPIRHEVVAVDYFLSPDGTKKLYINDSSHFGGLAVREFTEDFITKRCILADALDVFTFEPATEDKPKFDGTIISLQKILRYEGFFPMGVDYVERIGPLTKEGLIKFQLKYRIIPPLGNFGPITKDKLTQLYG